MPSLTRDKVIAHRGSSYAAPENTLVALEKALDEGVGAVEFDISLSRDDVPFLHHDDDFLRCANLDRPVRELNFDNIETLDVGKWFNPIFIGEKPPRLVDALAMLAPSDVTIILDIKAIALSARRAYIKAIGEAINQFPHLAPRFVYSSFDPALLSELRNQGIKGSTALLFETLPHDWLAQAKRLGVNAIHVDIDYVTVEQIQDIKANNYLIRAYTLNNPNRLSDFLPETFDGIFTDCPPLFLNQHKNEKRSFHKQRL